MLLQTAADLQGGERIHAQAGKGLQTIRQGYRRGGAGLLDETGQLLLATPRRAVVRFSRAGGCRRCPALLRRRSLGQACQQQCQFGIQLQRRPCHRLAGHPITFRAEQALPFVGVEQGITRTPEAIAQRPPVFQHPLGGIEQCRGTHRGEKQEQTAGTQQAMHQQGRPGGVLMHAGAGQHQVVMLHRQPLRRGIVAQIQASCADPLAMGHMRQAQGEFGQRVGVGIGGVIAVEALAQQLQHGQGQGTATGTDFEYAQGSAARHALEFGGQRCQQILLTQLLAGPQTAQTLDHRPDMRTHLGSLQGCSATQRLRQGMRACTDQLLHVRGCQLFGLVERAPGQLFCQCIRQPWTLRWRCQCLITTRPLQQPASLHQPLQRGSQLRLTLRAHTQPVSDFSQSLRFVTGHHPDQQIGQLLVELGEQRRSQGRHVLQAQQQIRSDGGLPCRHQQWQEITLVAQFGEIGTATVDHQGGGPAAGQHTLQAGQGLTVPHGIQALLGHPRGHIVTGTHADFAPVTPGDRQRHLAPGTQLMGIAIEEGVGRCITGQPGCALHTDQRGKHHMPAWLETACLLDQAHAATELGRQMPVHMLRIQFSQRAHLHAARQVNDAIEALHLSPEFRQRGRQRGLVAEIGLQRQQSGTGLTQAHELRIRLRPGGGQAAAQQYHPRCMTATEIIRQLQGYATKATRDQIAASAPEGQACHACGWRQRCDARHMASA